MDADITVFDPEVILDRATLDEPALRSSGIELVLVNGVFVVDGGVSQDGVLPGRAVRGESQATEPYARDRVRGKKVAKTTGLFASMLESQRADFLTGFDC